MPKLAMRRSRWRWYYLVRWNAELHSPKLSVLLKSEEKKHLISMKNSCLYDERWNPNDDVVGDIRKNITNMVFDADDVRAGFENHDSSPCFSIPYESWSEKCAKFLRPCNITKSRLVSRLRFFFLHLMMSPNDDNFFIRAKCLECQSNRSILFFSCVRARFSDENPSFSVSFLWSKVLLVSRKARENPLCFWRWLFSGISNAATADFSSCFCILDEA